MSYDLFVLVQFWMMIYLQKPFSVPRIKFREDVCVVPFHAVGFWRILAFEAGKKKSDDGFAAVKIFVIKESQ